MKFATSHSQSTVSSGRGKFGKVKMTAPMVATSRVVAPTSITTIRVKCDIGRGKMAMSNKNKEDAATADDEARKNAHGYPRTAAGTEINAVETPTPKARKVAPRSVSADQRKTTIANPAKERTPIPRRISTSAGSLATLIFRFCPK
ncbi:MAG: hypothetical protein IRY83_12825 [Chloroflexi bacterium]|nr:hypothetical protein [Chloroflexota bacterium]